MEYLLKPHIQMTEIEKLAMETSAYFIENSDALKVELLCKNEQGEYESIGQITNPKLRGMYEQVEWITQRHAIKTKIRAVKVGKD